MSEAAFTIGVGNARGAAVYQSPTVRDMEKPLEKAAEKENIPLRTNSKLSLRYPEQQDDSRCRGQDAQSPSTAPLSTWSRSRPGSSSSSFQTDITPPLPALQQRELDDDAHLEPLNETDIDPESFNLVAPPNAGSNQYSLETRSEQLFSRQHLQIIFDDPSLLLQFTAFLSSSRASSIPVLMYYIDATKALKAISYSNAIVKALDPIPGYDFTATTMKATLNEDWEEKARQAFDALVRDELPAYVTHIYTQIVSLSVQRRITGTLPMHLREASEGLAEVFCLTDPSRPDNPIVFASEEFHRTTQYGMNYVIGRNCRFLQGPKTNAFSVKRLRDKVGAGQEHCEVFLNYRRDGSPFMNLLMIAPLRDNRGVIRYFIGAQVDVSGLVKDCADLESLKRLVEKINGEQTEPATAQDPCVQVKSEFQEFSEMLNLEELDTVRRWGGRMNRASYDDIADCTSNKGNWNKPRLLITSTIADDTRNSHAVSRPSGKLSGVYENYLLVRPYPSLKVLFASPSLRVPGILQTPFMAKIGGSPRVREELTQALAEGRGVTAKVRWISKNDLQGRSRWIHCTPLLGSNGAIGVWMVVIVDDEGSMAPSKRYRVAPPVDPKLGRGGPIRDVRHKADSVGDGNSLASFAAETDRSGSPYTLRID